MSEFTVKGGKRVALRAVGKSFDDFVAVRGLDLNIDEGQFCTLLGPSGSGKTTTLKMIAGFEQPTSGQLFIGERDISTVAVAKRNIGMVFQNYALFPHMKVLGNVAFPLEMRKVPRRERDKAVHDVLELVGLSEFGDRYPRQLSGGQQQRVALARALVFNPDILLMDEPLGALDKNLRQNIQLELKKLHRRLGVTIIYVTHDQEEAMHLSDSVVVMNHGEIAQHGRPEDLYNAPKSEFVAKFVGECNMLNGRLESGSVEHKVHLPIGVARVPAVQDRVDSKDEVMLGVRPEKLRLGREAAECDNQFCATVDDVIFIGTGYKVLLQAGPFPLIAVVANRESSAPAPRGTEIEIGFNARDSFLLPRVRA